MIRAERQDRILTLTLNRPDELNAVNKELHDELATIFYDVQGDDESDVVVLTGAGKAFCAGGDLKFMKAMAEGREGEFLSLVDAKKIVFSMLDLEKPIIARVNGHAMGLGATIALLCDVVFMAETAKIGDPHVKAGVVAGDGGAVIWPQLVGYARAKEYLMSGDALEAKEAERIGLVNHVVPLDDLDEAAYGYARKLAAGPTAAVKWTKVSANIGLKQLAHAIMDTSLAYEWLTFQMEDHKEAVNAFLERRQPKFSGR
jgi:enoyl-CoA hydratase